MVDGMTDSSIKTQTYLAGHVLFRQGDVADDCYLVREGEISLSRTSNAGEDRSFSKVRKGEIIGEMSMIGDTPRTATATVVKDVELAVISRKEFEAQLDRLNPFMRRLIRLIVQRLRNTTTDLTRN